LAFAIQVSQNAVVRALLDPERNKSTTFNFPIDGSLVTEFQRIAAESVASMKPPGVISRIQISALVSSVVEGVELAILAWQRKRI
jgi:hypothetical protein